MQKITIKIPLAHRPPHFQAINKQIQPPQLINRHVTALNANKITLRMAGSGQKQKNWSFYYRCECYQGVDVDDDRRGL